MERPSDYRDVPGCDLPVLASKVRARRLLAGVVSLAEPDNISGLIQCATERHVRESLCGIPCRMQ
jgi:hypothetical protein